MKPQSRRNFLQTTGTLAISSGLSTGLGIVRSAHAAGSDTIRVAMIGCGGRGSGAIRDRLDVGDSMKLVAICDLYRNKAQRLAKLLSKNENYRDKVDVPEERTFGGFDAYKNAIDCLRPGDQIVIVTPPGFRPDHYRYAVEKGVHVFMEKPLFTDAPGYKHVLESNRIADEKNLKICVGLQRRFDDGHAAWVEKIAKGTIGDILLSRVYWNSAPLWCRTRTPNETEMEYQIRNWYHFVWLCGENICEQHVHSLDVGLWAHGKGNDDFHPVSANGQGGRQNSACPESLLRTAPLFSEKEEWWKWYGKNKETCSRMGQAWDHFFVEYTFADGSRMYSQCRHIPNCFNEVSQNLQGTMGSGGTEKNAKEAWLKSPQGNDLYRTKVDSYPYKLEHVKHVAAIRSDQSMNTAWAAANSNMTAVLGREAAYSGQVITWDDLVARGKRLFPEGGPKSFEETPPVMPDENGFYEKSVAKPGHYSIADVAE